MKLIDELKEAGSHVQIYTYSEGVSVVTWFLGFC